MSVSATYCTQTQMERYFSAAGITAFADHDGDGTANDDVVQDCIDQAADEINAYAMQRYEASVLATSTLITRWAVVLACYFLCTRRGSMPAESLQLEYDRIMGKLQEIPSGVFKLPGLMTRSDFRPGFSNMTVDRRYPFSKARVVRTSSDQINTPLPQKTVFPIPYE